jgi:hypothetical protein
VSTKDLLDDFFRDANLAPLVQALLEFTARQKCHHGEREATFGGAPAVGATAPCFFVVGNLEFELKLGISTEQGLAGTAVLIKREVTAHVRGRYMQSNTKLGLGTSLGLTGVLVQMLHRANEQETTPWPLTSISANSKMKVSALLVCKLL